MPGSLNTLFANDSSTDDWSSKNTDFANPVLSTAAPYQTSVLWPDKSTVGMDTLQIFGWDFQDAKVDAKKIFYTYFVHKPLVLIFSLDLIGGISDISEGNVIIPWLVKFSRVCLMIYSIIQIRLCQNV
jgi:hypothetical protein